MNLETASNSVLGQLSNVIEQMNSDDYKNKIEILGASVGMHARHILEFYLRLLKGEKTGVVNYDLRERDLRIETDRQYTLTLIDEITDKIKISDFKDSLKLELKYGAEGEDIIILNTNFERELAYNIEHAIHHMAIIKGVLIERFSYVNLPPDFGIASSTVRHHKGQ